MEALQVAAEVEALVAAEVEALGVVEEAALQVAAEVEAGLWKVFHKKGYHMTVCHK